MRIWRRVFLSAAVLFTGVHAHTPAFQSSHHAQNEAQLYHLYYPDTTEHPLVWTQAQVPPFQELLFSWNVRRPEQGTFFFEVSVFRKGVWSKWLPFASWGEEGSQKTMLDQSSDSHVSSRYSRIVLSKNTVGTGFRIRVSAQGGADMRLVHALHMCASSPEYFFRSKQETGAGLRSVLIADVRPQSQMLLEHPRANALCSPTTTAMIASALRRRVGLPVADSAKTTLYFAECARDRGALDIYGNWPLNVAQAYEATEGVFWTQVRRLKNFSELHQYLCKKMPVAVSLRGSISGGLKEYKEGHFVAVIGWDARTKDVICLDPAFTEKKEMIKRYAFTEFTRAWQRSRRLAYVFETKK